MQPVNCPACSKGYYADELGMKKCKQCPSQTTTSSIGTTSASKCQGKNNFSLKTL